MPPTATKPSFERDHVFLHELRRRVDRHLREIGRGSRDHWAMYLKTAIVLAVFVTAYVLLVGYAEDWWQGVLVSLVLGVATAEIGFNIQHDGGHQAYSEHRWINRSMAMTLDLIGGSSYIWRWKHAHFHHTYVNLAGHDSDIDLGILGRLAPGQRHRSLHRWQHFYLWPLYTVTAIRWHFYGDFRDLITGKIGEHRFPRPRGRDLASLIAGKLCFFALAFGIPLLFHPFGVVAIYYLLVAAITGVLLALVFQMAHVVEQASFPQPRASDGRVPRSWAAHQLETTVDFAPSRRWLTWLIGGLNFQIEHHLFSRVPHVDYPAIAPVVAATCHEFGMPYTVHATVSGGLRSHYRWLRQMGRAATV